MTKATKKLIRYGVICSSLISVPAFAQTQGEPPAPPPAPQSAPQQTAPSQGQPQLPPVQIQQQPTAQQPRQQGQPQLPPVEVIQKQRAPAKTAQKKPSTKKAPVVVTAPAPQPAATETAPLPPEPAAGMAAITPVSGSEIAVEKIPGAVNQVSGQDVQRGGSPAIEDALQQQVPGVILSDTQGNSFQTSVQYRGFESSPVNGTPQGLAVYQNGVRINEVFGDIVNWDFLPVNAIETMTVLSGDPIFGLNALGGAIAIKMKDGFDFHGIESDTRFGSWGRRQESVQAGQQVENFAAYIAAEGIHDDGWRDASPSRIRRLYADLGAKGHSDSEFHINYTAAANFVGVAAPSPVELLDQDWSKVFTTPQTTFNRLSMTSVNGSIGLTDTLKLSGVAYYRQFRQKHVDGNLSDAEPCGQGDNDTNPDHLCLDGDPLLDANKTPIDASQFGDEIGEIDRTTNRSDSFGGSLQATSKAPLFGHTNQFVIGTSIDHGTAKTTSQAELGEINDDFVVTGAGIFPFYPLGITPVNLKSTTDYYGVFFNDTFDVTNRLSVSAGGRYNYAKIKLDDKNAEFKAEAFPGEDSDLSGDHTFVRFNPSIGATYKLMPNLSLYGGYSEANRAPTPAELACSNPDQPCLLENFLTSDPDLKQVVSHTWEAGLRGDFDAPHGYGKVNWSFGLFRTLSTNDIISVLDPDQPTRGFFQNAGDTLRQGIEAKLSYRLPRTLLYANYAFVDATFQDSLELSSPNNPKAVPCTGAAPDEEPACIHVKPGDHLPAIPAHRIKAGFDYFLTPSWTFGADVTYASSQFFVGDEGNDNKKLPGYATVNLHTSYDINKHIQIYGLIDNLFNNKYALYGTYFEADEVGLNDPRTETPAKPFSIYAGLKVKW